MKFARHVRMVAAALAAALCLEAAHAQPSASRINNAKVIEMIKAGLDDDTVVKAIQQGKPDFDTSPDALIELKKQGASKKVLDVIQEASRPAAAGIATTPAPGTVAPPPGAGSTRMGVILVEGTNRTPMQQARPDTRASGGFVPFGTAKGRAVFEGAQSPFRIKATEPVFEVALPSNMRAADYVGLLLPEIKDKKMRRIETMRVQAFAGSSKGKNNSVTLQIEPIPGASSVTQLAVYRIKPEKPLAPGEYVLSVGHSYYDFGVDTGK